MDSHFANFFSIANYLNGKTNKIYVTRGVILGNSQKTIEFPSGLFTKNPITLVCAESSTVTVNVIMDTTTKSQTEILNKWDSNVFFNLIAVEP